jgi:ectoine hydroxylase-related dioxygenase (phytanoyl-CoA dioxygenase family)
MGATAEVSLPPLTSSGIAIEPESLGWLEESNDVMHDGEALRERVRRDGYLFLRGVLDVSEVLAARASVCRRLAEDGYLNPSRPEMEVVWNRRERVTFKPEYANRNPVVERLLYGRRMLDVFRTLLGGPVAHYDYTWLRAVAPGHGTPSHCDVVYMGRGDTQQLYTCWTPLGDVGFDTGGLMILQHSHLHEHLRETYGRHDVDTHCSNLPPGPDGKPVGDGWEKTEWIPGMVGEAGLLGKDCNRIRSHIEGELSVRPRWLTAEFRAGDILLFTMYTVHASMDNVTPDRIRLSTDSRYQPVGSKMDDRWIGENPPGHGSAGKRGRIC